ncbi:MAG: hypothetical protein MRZ17_04755 [Acholeplasmataceae bacterium]|nr:hypothetical protein [Acholeplasmataceae bacterium]
MICDKPTSVTVTPQTRNFIYETVKKIDQLQKEVLLENTCTGCEGSLFSRLYNTKPVSFMLCNGSKLVAQLGTGTTATTTNIFRIQELKGNSVILQLIDYSTATPTCSNYTCIFDLDCCCGLQCYSPILCTLCNEPTATN